MLFTVTQLEIDQSGYSALLPTCTLLEKPNLCSAKRHDNDVVINRVLHFRGPKNLKTEFYVKLNQESIYSVNEL